MYLQSSAAGSTESLCKAGSNLIAKFDFCGGIGADSTTKNLGNDNDDFYDKNNNYNESC